jgi:hypothetical protein
MYGEYVVPKLDIGVKIQANHALINFHCNITAHGWMYATVNPLHIVTHRLPGCCYVHHSLLVSSGKFLLAHIAGFAWFALYHKKATTTKTTNAILICKRCTSPVHHHAKNTCPARLCRYTTLVRNIHYISALRDALVRVHNQTQHASMSNSCDGLQAPELKQATKGQDLRPLCMLSARICYMNHVTTTHVQAHAI